MARAIGAASVCGIAGLLGGNPTGGAEEWRHLTHRMVGAIRHRGPDSADSWLDCEARVALGHGRLAVVDLSPAGNQPMASRDGRYVIAFNGEIYNHLAMRRELDAGDLDLKGSWRGHSDTETLLAGFSAWGILRTLERCVGMFAFAVWDREARRLTLARDRLGEKPLYYGWCGSGHQAVLLFGSELAALRAYPKGTWEIDRGALCLLMRHNCIPAPHSIYQGVRKLPAGHMLSVSVGDRDVPPLPYWSIAELAVQGCSSPFAGTPGEAIDQLEHLLLSAVRQQMVADVPLGAFLSGGIDSSTIVALMQAQSERPVKTFSIGFDETGYNEADHALEVARHLGTEHTELYVSARQAMDVIPGLPKLYSEPFADSSQIPTFLVSQLARSQVTVALSGDGGDELFSGYNRYVMTSKLWKVISRVPASIRRAISNGIVSVPPARWNTLLAPLVGVLPASRRHANIGEKLHKGAGILPAASIDALYRGLVSHWDESATLVIGAHEPASVLDGLGTELAVLDPIQRMMLHDALVYLPDDVLTKVDRAAMGVSLETRVPFLDHRVVEFAWHLPQALKLRDSVGKWVLRQVLYRYLPKTMVERPKMGFGVPIGAWLRGPLRDWAEDLLNESRLRQEGHFEPGPIRMKWTQHLTGDRDWQYHLWDVLMFQAWLNEN